jgi:hypothetical protein
MNIKNDSALTITKKSMQFKKSRNNTELVSYDSQNTQVVNVRSKRSNLLCDKFINNSLKSNNLA